MQPVVVVVVASAAPATSNSSRGSTVANQVLYPQEQQRCLILLVLTFSPQFEHNSLVLGFVDPTIDILPLVVCIKGLFALLRAATHHTVEMLFSL